MISFPVILINSLSVLMICMVIAAAWERRSDTGAPELIVLSLFMLCWAVCSFGEIIAGDLETKILWRNVTQIGVFGTPAAMLIFSIAYTGILKKRLKLLMIAAYSVQTASVLFIMTDGWHHLARTGVFIVRGDFYETLVVGTSMLSRVLISINFLYVTISLVLLAATLFDRAARKIRRQVLCVIAGLLICMSYSLVKVSLNERVGTMVPISGVFALADLLMLYGIFRFDLLMLAPIARNEAFNIMGDGIVIAAKNGKIADFNPAAGEIFRALGIAGEKGPDLSGMGKKIEAAFPQWHEALLNSRSDRFQLSLTRDGKRCYFLCDLYDVYNRKKSIGSITVLRDITEQMENTALLKLRAEKDGLTGLDNRQTFIDRVERRMAEGFSCVCLLFIDLDFFKSVNDDYGHAFGDAVLIEVCRIIQALVSRDTFSGRMGGEELAVFQWNTGREEAASLGERLRSGVAEHRFLHDGRPVQVTISIGIAVGRFQSFDALYQTADMNLYKAKQSGRNSVKL